MKRIILLLIFCKLTGTTCLFSQNKDSISLAMQRLNRTGDSLHRVQLAKDSAFQEQLNESMRKARESIEENRQKEIEKATEEVVARREKEQSRSRKTMLLALSAFLVTVVGTRFLFKRKKTKNI